jgi:hypothetical protein
MFLLIVGAKLMGSQRSKNQLKLIIFMHIVVAHTRRRCMDSLDRLLVTEGMAQFALEVLS